MVWEFWSDGGETGRFPIYSTRPRHSPKPPTTRQSPAAKFQMVAGIPGVSGAEAAFSSGVSSGARESVGKFFLKIARIWRRCLTVNRRCTPPNRPRFTAGCSSPVSRSKYLTPNNRLSCRKLLRLSARSNCAAFQSLAIDGAFLRGMFSPVAGVVPGLKEGRRFWRRPNSLCHEMLAGLQVGIPRIGACLCTLALGIDVVNR